MIAALGAIALAHPHAADAAIKYLQEEIRKKPVLPPVAPKYPDKPFKPPTTRGSQPGVVDRDQ